MSIILNTSSPPAFVQEHIWPRKPTDFTCKIVTVHAPFPLLAWELQPSSASTFTKKWLPLSPLSMSFSIWFQNCVNETWTGHSTHIPKNVQCHCLQKNVSKNLQRQSKFPRIWHHTPCPARLSQTSYHPEKLDASVYHTFMCSCHTMYAFYTPLFLICFEKSFKTQFL